MKLYQAINIIECHEPLIPIPTNLFAFENPPPYQRLGADYQGKSPYYLREGVVNALIQAQTKLTELKPHWRIKIFDGYRPISVQKFMVNYTFNSICQTEGLNPLNLADSIKEKILKQVYQFWAIPSDNPLTPPPHSTGSALDVTLIDEQGINVNMGGEIDEISKRSHPHYYAQAKTEKEREYHQNRELLVKVMSIAGFKQHQGEWWHFSLGDQMWAWLCNLEQPTFNYVARYGGINLCIY